MDYASIIEKKQARLAELEDLMGRQDFYDDSRKAGEMLREHRGLQTLIQAWDLYHRLQLQIADNQDLTRSGDAELAAMAEEELTALQKQSAELEEKVQRFILPPDPLEGRDVIMEIRAGTGGDEAALFAGDLYRMYSRYAEERGWKIEPMESSPAELGGFKEVVFKVGGEDVFSTLKYESGVHRVQRVPVTEAQGRIHTSAATVAVLPEAEEVDVQFKPDEVRIEVCRASGHGGQGVNTTDSAVQAMHIPTGMIVRCQDGRSQLKNKEKALKILRSRLLERKKQDMESLNMVIMYSLGRHPVDRELFFKAIEGFSNEQLLRNDEVTHNTILGLKLFGEKKRAEELQKLKAKQDKGEKA